MTFRAIIAVLFAAVLGAISYAQSPVSVIGPVTPGDCSSFFSTTQLQDGGICFGTIDTVQNANTFFAGPASGSPALPVFRPISGPDVPPINLGSNGNGGVLSPSVLAIGNGGTGQGTASAAFKALAPTPVQTGDVFWYNGTLWTTLAGNTGSTNCLQESSAGAPSWGTCGSGAGTVTQVNSGTGLTGGPITTTGTIALSMSSANNTLLADVNLTSTGSFFDGPSMAQGTSGVWYACGTITVTDTAGAASIFARLWDGTTTPEATTVNTVNSANQFYPMTLCGIISSPAGNIRISARDTSSTSGKIKASDGVGSQDSTIWGIRIK